MDERREIEHLKVLLNGVDDPRYRRGRRHLLVDILFIALAAMLAGADDAEAIEDFGETHEQWLRQFLEMPHGVPAQDTYLRVFAAIDQLSFQAAFRHWVSGLRQTWEDGHVAIDGKTLRRSFDRTSGARAIHMVSAWLAEDGLVLGQTKVSEKANEIVAIPELLRLLDVRDTTVTIDAMGCQRGIAAQLVDEGANYVLAVKDNQPTLSDNIRGFFADAVRTQRPLDDPAPPVERAREVDAGHGRIEERSAVVSRDLSWVENREDWKGLAAIATVRATRHDKASGQSSFEERYFILSDPALTAARLLRIVRRHWGIENQLHWVLDMTFDEDSCRVRTGNAAANFATVRHVALNLLRAVPDKRSIRKRRQRCGWDRDYLFLALTGCTAG